MRGEEKPREVEVSLASARTDNEHWRKSPDQMLTYHGARVWARRHAPEVMLGVYSPEEFDRNGTPVVDNFSGTTIEAEPPPQGQPRDTARAIGDELPGSAVDAAPQPKKPTVSEWLDSLEIALQAAKTADAVDLIVASERVQKAQDNLRNGARDRLNAIIKAAQDRTAPIENDPQNATQDDIFPGDLP